MDTKTFNLIMEFEERERLKGLRESTVYKKMLDLKKFIKHFDREEAGNHNKRSALTAGRDDLERYLELQRSRNISSSLYNHIIAALQEFYSFLVEMGEILVNPALKLERVKTITKSHRGIFRVDEIKRMLSVIPDTDAGIRDRAIIELLYSTGIRLNELLCLDINDIDFRNREIFIREGKGGKERVVPVGMTALKSLETYWEARYRLLSGVRDSHALFLNAEGLRMGPKVLRRAIERLKRGAGVKSKGSVHAFRHSFASHLLENGAPIRMIKEMLGHEYLDSTERYTHVAFGDLKMRRDK